MERRAKVEDAELLSRRGFACRAIAAATLGILPVASIGERDKAAPDHNNTIGLVEKPEDMSVSDWEEVLQRYANVLRVYGARLSSEQKQRVARILTTNQHMLASVRSFVVENGDPSACTLRLDVSK